MLKHSKDDMLMKKNKKIVLIAFFFVIGCSPKSYLSVNNPNTDANTEENIIVISDVYKSSKCKCSKKTAIALLNGSYEEYRNYHNECVHSSISNNGCNEKELTEWLSYAFIMAELYNDTLAAFDVVQIIEDLKIENGYLLSGKIIKYLEMVSKSNFDNMSFLAARKLYDIYNEGKYNICRDKEKARFYDTLSLMILRSNNQ